MYHGNLHEAKVGLLPQNPCSGKWSLAASPIKYIHSAAYFYITGVQGVYPVLNYRKVVDMVFNKK